MKTVADTVPADNWDLKMHRGVITPFHNGQPTLLNIIYDNDSWETKYMGSLGRELVTDAHINMHMIHVTVDTEGYAVAEMRDHKNKIDYCRHALERLEKLLQVDPNAFVMIRIAVWPPADWKKKYPDDMLQDENGKLAESLFAPVSYFSDRFFLKFEEGVKKLVTALEHSPHGQRILGYQPMTGYSGEWNRASTTPSRIADYSPVAKEAFRRHLMQKYKTIPEINASLGTSFKTEKDISIPSEKDFLGDDGNYFKSPQEARYTQEYLKFNSETIAHRILSLCKIIKKINPHRLVGTSYSYWFGEAQGGIRGLLLNGHLSWPMLGQSPYFDYLLSPPYYALCGASNPTTNHCLLGSTALYGKTYLEESDHPTHLICHLPEIMSTPIIWTYKMGDTSKGMLDIYQKKREEQKKLPLSERNGVDFGKNYRQLIVESENSGRELRQKPSDRIPANMQESVANTLRLGVNVVTKPISGIWWWDMEGCLRKCTGGISYNHPKLIDALRKNDEIFKKAVELDRSSCSQVAVFYSTEALYYAKAGAGNWEYLRDSIPLNLKPLGECGIPYDDYYFEDLEKIPDLDRYKLFIFVNPHYVTAAKRQWIETHLKKNRNVLVWFYGSGYVDEHGKSVDNIDALTGIKFKELNRKEMLATTTITDSSLATGLETGTTFGACHTSDRISFPAKPHFIVNDPEAEILGVSYRRKEPNFAIRRFKNWTSVYVPGGMLPARLLKNLARTAEINVYTDTEDIQIWANRSLLGIYAYPTVKGKRTITLPPSIIECRDLFSGKTYTPVNHKLQLEFNGAQTILFQLQHHQN